MSPARQTGYRLLGRRFDYLLHTRPAEWPIVAAHTAVGYALAVGLDGVAAGEDLTVASLGVLFWVICLNGGTLALNSAFDRDEADIAYLHRPPPPPAHLAGFGAGLMSAGFFGALLLPPGYRIVYGICFLLSILYSVPPFRLKAVPGADWAINMLGFGSLTPVAGWAATGQPIDGPGWLVLLAFCPLFAGLYPLTQIYQFEEDARRGDRTLARRLGIRRSLWLAVGCVLLGFTLFGAAAIASGWDGHEAWRWLALALAAAGWLIVLIPWLQQHALMTSREHQRGMYRALTAWAVTDLVVVAAWAA